MTYLVNQAVTLICGMWLGMIVTVVLLGMRSVWRDRHCTCDAEALETHAPNCPLYRGKKK